MKLIELQLGDRALITSETRDVTIYGPVTDRTDHGSVWLGQLSYQIRGNDFEASIVEEWPPNELAEAKKRARAYLASVESNIADKIVLEQALEIALDHLKEVSDRRIRPAGPFWKRGRR